MNVEEPAKAAETVQPLGPLCARLRSKKYYLLGRLPLTAADILDGSQHCWCQRTQQAVGPDADIVHPDECVAGRDCFEPLGTALR
jgi:hypothetical protein